MNNRDYSNGFRGIFPEQYKKNSSVYFYDRIETTPRNIVFPGELRINGKDTTNTK